MKKNFILIAASVLVSMTANAQLKKVYETKSTIGDIVKVSGSDEKIQVVAGVKNYNVLHIEDGKMMVDTKYTEGGSSVDKAYNADICHSLGMLVVCNSGTTVSGINLETGKKVWEINTFKEIGNDMSEVLRIYDKYVIVSDKKGKGNYSLTALDASNGKVLWSLDNEKQQVNLVRTMYAPSNKMLCIIPSNWSDRKNSQNIRFVNMESGKVEIAAPVTGWITTTYDSGDGYILMHAYVQDDNTSVTCVNLNEKKVQWSARLANKTTSTPMASLNEYYVSMDVVAGKAIVATQGIEAFDMASGKSAYNIPYKPYVEWGVGHYINSIFEPVVTGNELILADATSSDLAIKKIDVVTGKEIWSTGKLKKMEVAPNAYVSNNTVVVQFGGAVTFEVMNNTGIGKVIDPGAITGIDLQTGKIKWNLDKEVSYSSKLVNENTVVAFGVKNLQFIDISNGTVIKSQKEPFRETYFMTKVGVSRVKYQKPVRFDMSNNCIYTVEDDSFVKYTF